MQPFPSIVSENFNGGLVTAIDPVLLQPNQLQKALNVRFRLGGGFFPRPGYVEQLMTNFTSTGNDGIQGLFATDEEIFIAVNGKIFVTIGDNVDDAFEIHSGLDTSARVNMFEENGDIFVMNGVDNCLRIARSKTASALVSSTSTTLDVSLGQGWRFNTSGTVVVVSSLGADEITVSGKTNDELTITDSTVGFDHPSESKIFEVNELTSIPKFAFGIANRGTWIAGGVVGESAQNYNPNTIFWSRGSTGINPEYFWDFSGAGSGFKPVTGGTGGLTALFNTKDYFLICKKDIIHYCPGINTDSDLVYTNITESYGAAGQDCLAQVNDQIMIFTGKGLKEVGEKVGLNNTAPSINPQFDDKVFDQLQALDEDQSDAVVHFNPNQKLLKLWCNKDGARTCFVIDANVSGDSPWSIDTNKPTSCAVDFKKETFWGSSFEPKLFQDEVSYDDNGSAIRSEVRTAEFNAGNTRISKYFKYLYMYGLIGESSTVTVNVYFDDELIQTFTLVDDLVVLSAGEPIGRALVGSGIAASEAEAVTGFPFEIEKVLKKRRQVGKMSIEYVSDGTGQVYEMTGFEIKGNYSSKFDRKIRT